MSTDSTPPTHAYGKRRKRQRIPGPLVVGAVILIAVVVLVALSPVIAPFAYDAIHSADRLSSPSLTYLAGTDEYGRDVLTRTLVGGRLSLFMGFAATFIGVAIGVPIGLVAGYFRGVIDELSMRMLDLMMAFPPILLVLFILSITTPSLWKTTAAVGVLSVPAIARLTRSMTLSLANDEFIVAAHARGETTLYILFREILPNAWPAIIVEGSLRVTFAILVAAVLSFLGFGVRPPDADWGMMIGQARAFLQQAPWIAITPGLAMCATVIGINLFGDGLRVYLDPRIRARR